MHVRLGLQQALRLLLLSVLAGAVLAGLWWLRDGEYLRRFGLVLMGIGALIAVTGGTALSREVTLDARAVLGAGPDREEPGSGQHLGPVGVFLFVSVPLVLVGGLLLDAA